MGLAGGVVLIVVGGVIIYLTIFRRGVKQGLRKLREQWPHGPGQVGGWLPFAFVMSVMLIAFGAVLIYLAIANS